MLVAAGHHQKTTRGMELRERGREGGRERGREGGREGGRERGREGGRERGREGGRERGLRVGKGRLRAGGVMVDEEDVPVR